MRGELRRTGFTLVEMGVCVVIVSLMLAAALRTVGQSAVVQYKLVERARGQELGRALMAEVLEQAYVDPVATTPAFGPEAGETSRSTYDDVDDYNGLVESPPLNKDGTAISVPQASTWKRTVAVTWINPLTLAVASPQIETGAKRISVTVYHNTLPAATIVAVKTNAP